MQRANVLCSLLLFELCGDKDDSIDAEDDTHNDTKGAERQTGIVIEGLLLRGTVVLDGRLKHRREGALRPRF